MKLIVGLGNPGKEYENTRHNVGFMIIDYYCQGERFKEKFNGLYLKKNINGEQVVFLKPLSYMNLSGEVVAKYIKFYKINPEDLLIVRDDLDLPIGTARFKFDSSSGGDNGVKSIIHCLGTKEFCQFKVGISNNKLIDTKNYVLGTFKKDETEKLNNIIIKSKEVIDFYINNGIDVTMNKYNGILK